jgi:predicted small lipoprotein YifL
MPRTSRSMMAAVCLTALTACGTTAPQAAPTGDVPVTSPSPTLSPSPSVPPSPSAAPATSGPKLVDADLSQLKSFAIDLGVPVVITTSADAGAEYHLGSRPDGSVTFAGTSVTDSTRMTLRPAKVRKRTEGTRNRVLIVASPVAAGSGPESCVTDDRKGVVRMRPCRPGDAEQSWRLVPAGDSGLFELFGDHTALRVDEGKLVEEGGWSAFQTLEVKP